MSAAPVSGRCKTAAWTPAGLCHPAAPGGFPGAILLSPAGTGGQNEAGRKLGDTHQSWISCRMASCEVFTTALITDVRIGCKRARTLATISLSPLLPPVLPRLLLGGEEMPFCLLQFSKAAETAGCCFYLIAKAREVTHDTRECPL